MRRGQAIGAEVQRKVYTDTGGRQRQYRFKSSGETCPLPRCGVERGEEQEYPRYVWLTSPLRPTLTDEPHSTDDLAAQLTAFTSLFPSHLVALTSVPTLSKRKSTSHTLGSPAINEAFATSAPDVSSSSTPLPAESYRLLTPPLILSLGIVFGLIVPLVLVVISALAGIKSPVRESAGGKSRVVGIEKKNQ